MVCAGSENSAIALLHPFHEPTGACEIGRGVDLHAEAGGLDQADGDSHPGFERAQLLEMLALFEHATRQSDELLERGASISIEPDMLVMRSRPPRHDRLAEIERARWPHRIGKTG